MSMLWKPLFASALCLLAITAAGCGGDDDPTDPDDLDPPSNNVMTATVDGQPWVGVTSTLSAETDPDIAGAYVLRGTHNPGIGSFTIDIELYNIDAPGTYPLGVNPTIFGGSATYITTSGAAWLTPQSGAAGEITVTTLSTSRIKGTFNFFLIPLAGTPANGVHNVTNGVFDLAVEGTATPVPDDIGSKFSGSVNGLFYNAAYVAVTRNGDDLVVNTSTNSYSVTFFLTDAPGPGTYPLALEPPLRSVVVNAGSDAPEGVNCCWGPSLADSGAIVISSLSSDRMVGTFSMTLAPRAGTPATTPLVITNGTFDAGFGVP